MRTNRIFVVGHMGTGKYIFTEALAKQLDWNIVDANPSIERYIGRLTKDILGEQGTVAFNQSQAEMVIPPLIMLFKIRNSLLSSYL